MIQVMTYIQYMMNLQHMYQVVTNIQKTVIQMEHLMRMLLHMKIIHN